MLKFTVQTEGMSEIAKSLSGSASQAEMAVAQQIKKDTEPYVPMLTGEFRRRTMIAGNRIIYPGPFARYLWEGFKMVDSATGRPAFYIKGVGFRFRSGARLEKTTKRLVYTKTSPIQASDHWFDKSEAQNKERWLRTADKAVIHYLKRK
ncbi:MAG: hypothetical protein HFH27_11045 [Clostridiaceae bacterium]|nr:hypothetical protein [Clostridiaceae bacterium]